jgi:uncharacterized membrane protein YfcA
MWEQYKRTFIGMQVVITAVAVLVFFASHYWPHAVGFYLFMQLGSALGALWGNRLRRRIQERQLQQTICR